MNEIAIPPGVQQSSADNTTFWDELCGSVLARSVGIVDASRESLARFDRAYLDLYPYLLGYVRPEEWRNRRVVEVGLGYGTLSQQFLACGARYIGVDIARGPAAMVNHRAHLLGRPACAVRNSVLALAVADESVDCLVSIGCFHHTGSVEQCIRETYRVLRPGGVAVVMVYNQFSYRHWMRWPLATSRAWLADRAGRRLSTAPVHQRKKYDANAAGLAAPETVFLGTDRLRQMFSDFGSVEVSKENNTNLLRIIPRRMLLPTLGRRLGLDLYVRAVK